MLGVGPQDDDLIDMSLELLLVDDDTEYAALLSQLLQREGMSVQSVPSGRQALEKLSDQQFDLVLLDVSMPVMDGFTTLERFRREANTPVIMLTSRIASRDRVQGLDSGADDYICKPCDPEELLSRIRAVLRRAKQDQTTPRAYAFGSHHFDLRSRELTCAGTEVRLTSLESELLTMLLGANGRVVNREALAISLQDRSLDVFDRSLDVHISHLRSKLGRYAAAIQTVRGVGYLLKGITEERSL